MLSDLALTADFATDTIRATGLNAPGPNPPIVVASDMVLQDRTLSADTIRAVGTLDVGATITCSDPTSTSIVSNKNLTLGQTGDEFGDTFLHIRNRNGENGVIFESTNANVPLIDITARMGNDVQRNIRLEGRPEHSVLEAPCWKIGGAKDFGGLGQLLVSDMRCAVRDHLTIGTTSYYPNRLVVSGSVIATSYNNFSDASLKDDVLDVSESECVTLLEAVAPKTYRRNDLDEHRRIGFIAQDLAANAPPAFNVWAATTADGVEVLTVDYARLSAILWGVCRNLNARVAALEAGT